VEAGELGNGGDAITIGQIAIGCALGYLDFRYQSEEWRARSRRIAQWYGRFAERKSMQLTVPKAA
jgi:glutathione S-transferase